MKILISNDNRNAHYYIRMGYARALVASGHEVVVWELTQKSAFDMFDEFEPDLFWGQTYNLNASIIKCIEERPHMRVILRAPDWSDFANTVAAKYPILTASKDLVLLEELRQKTGKPDFLHCHYTQKSLEKTHENYLKRGYKIHSMLNGADIFGFYKGSYKEEYDSDIAFVGGRWGYKAQNLDPYLVYLCRDFSYNVKIFGNQPWGIPQYCGFAQDHEIKDIFASAKICPNISEPHSNEYGYDIVERPFKLLSNGCFVISDYVQDLVDMIPDGIVYAKDANHFHELVKQYVNDEDGRRKVAAVGHECVMNNHTYFHRAANMFRGLNMENNAIRCIESLEKYR